MMVLGFGFGLYLQNNLVLIVQDCVHEVRVGVCFWAALAE
jgi:hypothetical protein